MIGARLSEYHIVSIYCGAKFTQNHDPYSMTINFFAVKFSWQVVKIQIHYGLVMQAEIGMDNSRKNQQSGLSKFDNCLCRNGYCISDTVHKHYCLQDPCMLNKYPSTMDTHNITDNSESPDHFSIDFNTLETL